MLNSQHFDPYSQFNFQFDTLRPEPLLHLIFYHLQCDENLRSSVQYRITHKTAVGSNLGGLTENTYFFTLIGESGETGSHDCPADRTEGVTASCTIEDANDIGRITAIRIRNRGDDTWGLVSISVESSEGMFAAWQGSRKRVTDFGTIDITLSFSIGKSK